MLSGRHDAQLSCPCAALFCPASAMCTYTPFRPKSPRGACVCYSSAAEVPPIHPFVDIEHRLRMNDCFLRRHDSLRSAASYVQPGPIHSARKPLASTAASSCGLAVTACNGRQPSARLTASPFECCGVLGLPERRNLLQAVERRGADKQMKAGLNLTPTAQGAGQSSNQISRQATSGLWATEGRQPARQLSPHSRSQRLKAGGRLGRMRMVQSQSCSARHCCRRRCSGCPRRHKCRQGTLPARCHCSCSCKCPQARLSCNCS